MIQEVSLKASHSEQEKREERGKKESKLNLAGQFKYTTRKSPKYYYRRVAQLDGKLRCRSTGLRMGNAKWIDHLGAFYFAG